MTEYSRSRLDPLASRRLYCAIFELDGSKERCPPHLTIIRDGFMNDPIDEALGYLSNQGTGYDVVKVRKQAKIRLVNRNMSFDYLDRGVAAISTYEP